MSGRQENARQQMLSKETHGPQVRAAVFRTTSFAPILAAATLSAARPSVVNGQPTFQYGGYSFVLVDPWPVGWAYSDDCYIDYVDGEYFLFDLVHPGVRIALDGAVGRTAFRSWFLAWPPATGCWAIWFQASFTLFPDIQPACLLRDFAGLLNFLHESSRALQPLRPRSAVSFKISRPHTESGQRT